MIEVLRAAGLSKREAAVLSLLIEGRSTKEAAAALGIPEVTARRRMHQCRKRLGFTSNEALVAAIMAGSLP